MSLVGCVWLFRILIVKKKTEFFSFFLKIQPKFKR